MTTQTTNELNNKNDLKSTTNHNSGRTTNNTSNSLSSENCVLNESNGNIGGLVGAGTPTQNDSPSWIKFQALKQRKLELEKLLSEKINLIEELQRQEEEVQNGNILPANSATGILKRKIGANIELPKNQLNSIRNLNNLIETPNFLPNIERLLHEKKHLQEICHTLFKLTNNLNTSNLVQKNHISEFEIAQQKLSQINEQLNLLKRLEINQEQSTQNCQLQLVKSNSLRGVQNPLIWTPISTNLGSSTLNSINKSPKQQNINKQKSPIQCRCNSNNNMNLMQQQILHNSTTPESEKSVCRNFFCNDSELYCLQQHNCSQRNNHHQYHHHKHISFAEQSMANTNLLHSQKNLIKNDYLLKEHRTIKSYQKKSEDIQQFNQDFNLKFHQQAQSPLCSKSPVECETNNSHTTASQQKYLQQPIIMNTQNISAIQQCQYQKQILQTQIPAIPISPVHHKYENSCEPNVESPLLLSDKYYFSPTQLKYSNGSFIKSSQNVRPQDSKQKLLMQPKTKQIDDISLALHITDGNKERLGRTGLNEYWQHSPNNDRAWDPDKIKYDSTINSYDPRSSKYKLNQENLDNIQEKLSSLHNFDLLVTNHSDQLSITSIGTTNTNLNQLLEKDKSWVETALDGPLVKAKQTYKKTRNCDSNFETLTQTQQSLPTTLFALQNTQIELTPQFSPALRHQSGKLNQNIEFDAINAFEKLKSRNFMNYTQIRPKVTVQPAIQTQEIISKFKMKKQGRQMHFSHSTPYLNSAANFEECNSKNANIEEFNFDNAISKLDIFTNLNVEKEFNNNTMKLKEQVLNNQTDDQNSEISDQNFQMTCIRSGTPKNMSVVHPAIFMPYKEYSKPFEMSDFYKYSTKFRQQQQKFSFRRKTNDWDPIDIKKTAN